MPFGLNKGTRHEGCSLFKRIFTKMQETASALVHINPTGLFDVIYKCWNTRAPNDAPLDTANAGIFKQDNFIYCHKPT